MNRLEIKNAVVNILQERGFEDADSESLLLESDLGLDSLDRVELIMDVEERFGITILELEGNGWNAISNVVDTVERLVRIKEVKDPPLV